MNKLKPVCRDAFGLHGGCAGALWWPARTREPGFGEPEVTFLLLDPQTGP